MRFAPAEPSAYFQVIRVEGRASAQEEQHEPGPDRCHAVLR